ncbi:MAG: GMC family oxidoreductase [Pseudomonadota bacterium]
MQVIETLAQAQDRQWNAVLVGTSFASLFFAHNLPASWNILAIEKGSLVPHSEQLRTGHDSYLEPIQQRNRSGKDKDWVAHTLVGGNSNCWWACTPRFHPNDFKLRSTYGVGHDWPIGYDELAPYYLRAEQLMEINGGESDHILPRRSPFPHPPHAPSLSDEHLRRHSKDWFAQPSARATTGQRAPCCANGVCGLCPVDSKFTVLNGFATLAHPNLHILCETEARSLHVEAGHARGVEVRHQSGAEGVIQSDLIGLGANALFNAAILMRTGLETPALGRYLHEQASQPVRIDIDRRNFYGGTSITGHGYPLYDGPHRSSAAAVLIENSNAPALLRPERDKTLNRLSLKLIAEDIPSTDNRVVLEADQPVIDWNGHSDYAYRGLERARESLPTLLPFDIEDVFFAPYSRTESHIQGTTRMGVSREDSVIDDHLILHDLRNVFALGAGAFPSSSAANPTLTLSALSLRAGAFAAGRGGLEGTL